MYFDTVACETVRPSFNSSPWILGAPHSGFARLICRIRSRRSLPIAGRPHRRRLFHAQYSLKPRRCHRTTVSGRNHLQGTPPILPESRQHDPEDPVHLRQPRPWLTRFPHGELLPQREILQRQLAARANRGAQCPKKDPKPSDHDRPIADHFAQRKIVATDEFLEGTGVRELLQTGTLPRSDDGGRHEPGSRLTRRNRSHRAVLSRRPGAVYWPQGWKQLDRIPRRIVPARGARPCGDATADRGPAPRAA
jgi:hypothetical protein